MNLNDELCSLGFSDKESQIILALNVTGRATPGMLAKRTGISRPTVYNVLEELEAVGIVLREAFRSKIYFSFLGTQSFVRVFERRTEKARFLESRGRQLALLLEEQARRERLVSPLFEVSEGEEALDSFLHRHAEEWHHSLVESDGIWWGYEDERLFCSYRGWFERIWTEFAKMRKEAIRVRIFTELAIPEEVAREYPLTEFKKFSGQSSPESTLWLMGSSVVVFSTKEQPHYAYQLRDGALADTLRHFFIQLWESCGADTQ